MTLHTLVIIPAAAQAAANALAAQAFDTSGGGELTFTVPLVTPPGTETTHFWCAAQFSPEKRALLTSLTSLPEWSAVRVYDYDLDDDPGFASAKLSELGLATNAPPMM